MDIITNTILPGSAPGPGLPGERLGIPPRAKREAMAAEQRAASGGGGVPPPPPPMGNQGVGGYDQGRPPLPPPNMGGGGYGGDNGAGQSRMGYGGGPRRPLSPQRGELSLLNQSGYVLMTLSNVTAPGAGGPPAGGGGGGGGYGYGRRY